MSVQETQHQAETTESPEPPGFNETGPASYYAPEGFGDPAEHSSGYADGRI